MKRALSLILALAILIDMIPMTALAMEATVNADDAEILRQLARETSFPLGNISGNIAVLGDSTISGYPKYSALSTYFSVADGYTITDISKAGDTIVGQLNKWKALSVTEKSALNYVFVQIGLNDIDETVETFRTQYTNLVAQIRTDAPNAMLILGTMVPCKQRWKVLYPNTWEEHQERWEIANEDIQNGYYDCDSVAYLHTEALGLDGNLRKEYNHGDHIHENAEGAKVIAYSWYLAAFGHSHRYSSIVTTPTCTEQGYTTYTCACGDSYVDDYTYMAQHSFGQWYAEDEDTRKRNCNVCGYVQTFVRLSLPQYYCGDAYVELNHSGFYCGTQNIAQILNFQDGTYTYNGVTITVSGNQISAHGTAQSTIYFDLQTGTFGTPDYTRDPGYSLPNGNYRFGLSGTGSQFPTACIRYPSGVGNILASDTIITKNGISGSDFGVPYLYFPQGKTYNFDGTLVLTLETGSAYDSQISSLNQITDTGFVSLDGYLWSSSADVAIFGGYGGGQIQYTDGTKDYLDIFLPSDDGYVQIQMNLVDSASINAYGWRLSMMYACDPLLNQLFPITNSGEFEMAIKLDGRPDFIGMGAHGSEIMTSFTVCVDGRVTDLSKILSMTSWTQLRIVRNTEMYDPNDETTLVGYHTVTYDFDLSGMTVSQSVEWVGEYTCTTSYMMMFPVLRAYDDLQITDTYFDDYDSAEHDVSQQGFTTYPVQWTKGASKMTLYSRKSGITASMESLETSVLTGTSYKHCANSAAYNKLYFTICGGGGTKHITAIGDVWETSARYEVRFANPEDICGIYDHTYTPTVTAPTCTEQGYTTYTCACGDSYVGDYVDASGHSFTDYISDGNATYEADGTKTALCDHGCGEKDTLPDPGSRLFPEQVTSSVYAINDGILSRIPAGTTVETMLAGLDWGKYCAVFDANGKAMDASAKVATGMVVKLMRGAEVKQTLTIAVRGDTNGDGGITLTDFVQIKAHLLQKQMLTGAAATAADYSADGAITITDFIQVKALLLKKTPQN